MHHASRPPDNYPVDDLDKRDDAEAEKEAEESTKRGDEVNWSHLDPPLKFYRMGALYFGYWFPPMTVSLPKKMLTTAMSSSQAL